MRKFLTPSILLVVVMCGSIAATYVMARLVEGIELNHAVTAEQIQTARGERNRAFDFAVALMFIPIYLFGAAAASRPLWRRFASHSRSVRLVATALASLAASFLGLQVGQLWLTLWEIIRVGNGHMSSFRLATQDPWSQQHVGALFVAGVVMFWGIALLIRRATPQSDPDLTPTVWLAARDTRA
jgi:hypothetical protein